MQAFFDALTDSTTLVVIAVAAAVVAIGVLVAGARRTRMDDAALSATLAAAWRSELDSEPVAPLDVTALIAEARSRRESGGQRDRTPDRVGRCGSCDRAAYTSRKAARRAAKATLPGEQRVSAYPCPSQPDLWHFGHRPSGGRELLRWRRGQS